MDKLIKKQLLKMQKREWTDHFIYKQMASRMKEKQNIEAMSAIAAQEKIHAQSLEKLTQTTIKVNKFKVRLYYLLSIVLGFTFMLRIMAKREDFSDAMYQSLGHKIPEALQIRREDAMHKAKVLETIDEARLRYIRSIVLGLNDALVELSGALAGLTFALANTALISLSGLITGIAASLSMAASEYISTSSEGRKDALKSSLYTGTAYIIVVTMLILPYLLLDNRFYALGIMLVTVLFIITIFNYYLSVTLNIGFKQRFLQMFLISMGVATISFVIGLVLGQMFDLDL